MRRFVFMLTIIIAGEMIFGLPFHTARFFRATYLEAFGFTNTELGDVFAVYGITAMLAYFPGGVLADHFPARALMSLSLFATAAGGLYMATFPDVLHMAVLYGYWGLTSVFLFWSAMISATRTWGGEHSQGKAFGILDGGRGLVAAGFALLAVTVMSRYLPGTLEQVSHADRRAGFRQVILLYSAAAALSGLLTWVWLPNTKPTGAIAERTALAGMWEVLRRPVAWAQAAIIVFAYSGFKGLDNYSLYAVQVMGMNEVDAARFTAWAAYLRPLAAVAAGIMADRFSASKTIAYTFLLLVFCFGFLSVTAPGAGNLVLLYANILVSFFAVFALRGVYFALLQETRVPWRLTGTTVGMVSFIGFTPDVFFGPVSGRILDSAPGLLGHQRYFLFLAVLSLLGLVVVAVLMASLRADRIR